MRSVSIGRWRIGRYLVVRVNGWHYPSEDTSTVRRGIRIVLVHVANDP